MRKEQMRCCFNCTKWHKKGYIHCQCSGPWGGDIFGDKNCVFRAKKVRSNVKLTSSAALVPNINVTGLAPAKEVNHE